MEVLSKLTLPVQPVDPNDVVRKEDLNGLNGHFGIIFWGIDDAASVQGGSTAWEVY